METKTKEWNLDVIFTCGSSDTETTKADLRRICGTQHSGREDWEDDYGGETELGFAFAEESDAQAAMRAIHVYFNDARVCKARLEHLVIEQDKPSNPEERGHGQ